MFEHPCRLPILVPDHDVVFATTTFPKSQSIKPVGVGHFNIIGLILFVDDNEISPVLIIPLRIDAFAPAGIESVPVITTEFIREKLVYQLPAEFGVGKVKLLHVRIAEEFPLEKYVGVIQTILFSVVPADIPLIEKDGGDKEPN